MDTGYCSPSYRGPHCHQRAVSTGTREPQLVTRGRGQGGQAAGAHMAVMVSLWKVTKAMPRGFSFTFSFSRLYSSFSFCSSFV